MYLARPSVWHPEERLTNAQLSRLVDTSDEWIVEHVGIRERRRSPPDMPVHAMGARAAALALEGFDPARLDLVVAAPSIADHHIPAVANFVAAEAGATEAAAFDVRAACSGFVFALHAVRGLFAAGGHRAALVVVPEAYTHATDYSDRATCVLGGDAAFACLAFAERPEGPCLEVEDTFVGSRSKDALAITIPVGGFFRQDGAVVQAFAIRKMAEVVKTAMERRRLTPETVDWVIGHQANLGILERACARAGIAAAKNLTNIAEFGNTGAAGAPSVLAQEMAGGRFADGARIVVATVGAGVSWGGAVLRMIA